ncbi:MAG: PAS domain S-box protein [Bacteroidales bacterium]|nr:PAS domain S-box protein [Bacteroidales bacterium]
MDFLLNMTQLISEMTLQKHEQIQLNRSLEESEEKMRSIYSVAPAGIGVVSDRVLKEVNPRICEMTGYSREELIDKNSRILYPSQEEHDFVGKEKYDQIRAKGTGKVETYWQKKDGTIINILMASTPIDKNDYSKGVTFTALDITERKQAEEKLHESEKRFRVAQEMSPDGFTILHPVRNEKGEVVDFTWVYENQTIARINGTDSQEVTGKRLLELFPTHRGSSVFETYLDVANKGKTQIMEEVYVGEIISKPTWLRLVIVSMGEDIAILTQDITERKQAEEALRESEEMMRNSQSVAHICSYSTNLNVNEIEKSQWVCSPEFYKIFGIDETYPHTIEGWAGLIHPDYREEIFACHQSVIEEKKSFNHEYKIIRKKDGAERWVHGTGELEYDKKGNPVRMHGAIQDITERKQAALKLQQSENRYRTIFNSTGTVTLLVRNNTYIEMANEEAKNVTGHTAAELAGTKWTDHVAPHSLEKMLHYHQTRRTNQEEVPDKYEVDLIHKSGEIRRTLLTIGMIPNTELSIVTLIDVTDRYKATEKLKESEERYKALHNASFGGIAIHDKGVILECNQGLSDITGYSLDELIGMDGLLLIAPESRDLVMANILAGYEKPYEAVGLRKNGDLYPIRLEARNIPYKGKTVRNVEFRDITEIKQAERSLRQSEEKYRRIADNVSDVVWMTDLEMNPTYISPSVERVLGIKPDEYLKLPITQTYPPASLEKFQKTLTEEFAKEQDPKAEKNRIFQLEVERYYADGTIGWDAISATFIRDEQNNPIAIQGVSRDITDRKRAEENLKQKQILLRTIVDSIPDAIYVKDTECRKVLANKADCINTGVKKEEDLIGKTDFDVFPAEIAEKFFKDDQEVMKQGVRVVDREEELIQPNGDKKWLLTTKLPLYNDKGEIIGLVGIGHNITDRKRAEKVRQLQYNIARATITTRNLNELFDTVKNELNTLIDAKNFVIAFYNEETGMLSANVERDEKDEIPIYPANKSLTGYVIRQNRPVLLRKNEILQLYEEGIIELIGTTAEAWLGVPLKVGDKILGAVVVQNFQNPDVYDKTSIQIMELLAHELSMFIDRQRSEEKANKLSRAVEQSSVSVVITDKEGSIEYVNPYFIEVTGYSFEEVKGKSSDILKSGHHSTAFYKELWETILSGNDWEGEFLNKKKTGELYWAKAVITPIVNRDGVITNFISIKQDITERKKMLEELVAAKEKAQESDKLKTAFINNISHEVRTPLNGILGFGTLLSETDPSPEEKQQMLEIVQKSGNRLMNTMTDYMDIARIVSGTMEVHSKEFLLQPVFEEVIEESKQLCDSKKIGFEADYQNDHDLTLDSDPELISRKYLIFCWTMPLNLQQREAYAAVTRLRKALLNFLFRTPEKG